MPTIDEKRVYDAKTGTTRALIASSIGVVRVEVSDDIVGEFGIEHRCTARDLATGGGALAVATDEDVLVGAWDDDAAGDGEGVPETDFEALNLGPAAAVGFVDDGRLLVARDDGTVVRGAPGAGTGADDWTAVGELDGVRAIDGDFVAAESGVYRAGDDDLTHVGLDDARDVTAAGTPLAATGAGLFRLGNGWLDERDGEFRAVSAARKSTPSDDRPTLPRAHAAGEGGLLAREDGGEWRDVDLPVSGDVAALARGEDGAYAVTGEGTFLLSVGDGWNHQLLGLRGARAVAAPW